MHVASSAESIEETSLFKPRFDAGGLIVCITADVHGTVLMVAYMNAEALRLTLDTGTVHYWSRSRSALWRKGDTSGQVQTLIELKVDCDQDALLLTVAVAGDGRACHTGRHSCFYRRLRPGSRDGLEPVGTQTAELSLSEVTDADRPEP